ncbi:hypothetical protein [Corynebacterium lubricantis]|nr:hypothetical protein [Corynebacterium lubricantis]
MDLNAIMDSAVAFSSTNEGNFIADLFDFLFNLFFPSNADPAS